MPYPAVYCSRALVSNNRDSTWDRELGHIDASARNTHGRRSPFAGMKKRGLVFLEGLSDAIDSCSPCHIRADVMSILASYLCCVSRAYSRCGPSLQLSNDCSFVDFWRREVARSREGKRDLINRRCELTNHFEAADLSVQHSRSYVVPHHRH